MTDRIPVSVRLTDNELAVLDAAARHLSAKHSVQHSRADVVRLLLRRLTPAQDATPEARVWRETYQRAFGSDTLS